MDTGTLLAKLSEATLAYGPSLVGALLILSLGWLGTRIAVALLRHALRRARLDETLTRFGCSIARVVLLAMVGIAVLERLGVDTTSFVAVLAAAGLAVGLAFQDSLSNFASGVLLIVFRPFKVGDFVEAGGTSGTVEEIQIFTTVLKTPDNKRVIVGNSSITGSTITNYSANETRRVDLVFGIGYRDDIARARDIIRRILDADERVLEDPAPAIFVLQLGESSVDLAVRPWARGGDYWGVHADVTERVKLAFDEAGISIPFPQTDVHLHPTAPAAA